MKLLYVYIQNFGELLKNEGFEFSNEFIVTYSKDDQVLSINENASYLDGFYGEVISDITAIVGINGVGKTTLLNLIGRNLKDRLELSNISRSRKIIDEYFMIYHVKDDIFYFEGIGNIGIKNLDGYMELFRKSKTVVNSFFFKYTNYNCEIMEYKPLIRDKIVYIIDNYTRSTNDLLFSNMNNEKKNPFLPRILGDNISLVEWYSVYIDLCNEKMVNSNHITILFSKNKNVVKQDFFVVDPLIRDCTYQIDANLMYTEENIDDFFSHFMSCIMHYYVQSSNKVCGVESYSEWNKLKDKYNGKKGYSVLDYRKIFKKCKEIINKYGLIIEKEDTRALLEYIEYLNNLFFALHDIKDYIIPGIDEFQLQLSGECKNDEIEYFFECYMKVKDFIDYNFGNDESREDLFYNEEDFSKYPNTHLNLKLPIDIGRINISTGEKNLIELLSKIAYEVKDYCGIQPVRVFREKKTYIILVDEIEATMHLEWSRNLLDFIIKYIERQMVNFSDKPLSYADLGVKVQLIFTTHSPFLLSDLNKDSIIALEFKDGITKKKKDICAFAQNIQRIMNNEFFIKDCYGTFAQNKIQEIIERLNNEERLNDDERKTIKLIVGEIGEPLLKNKLEEVFMEKLNKDNDISYEEIKLIKKFKDIYGDLNNKDVIKKIKILLKDEI